MTYLCLLLKLEALGDVHGVRLMTDHGYARGWLGFVVVDKGRSWAQTLGGRWLP